MNPRNYTQRYEPNGRPVTNLTLIDDIRFGDQQAWVHFFHCYWRWLVGIARGMGASPEDAEDIAQKTLIALSRQISQFTFEPARGRFSAWLMTVLRNNVINAWKRGCTDPLHLRVNQEETHPDPIDTSAGLANHIITPAMADHFEQLIAESLRELQAQVSETHWHVFDLYNLQEHPVGSIAIQFDLRPGTVWGIVSRMLKVQRRIICRRLRESDSYSAVDWQGETLGREPRA